MTSTVRIVSAVPAVVTAIARAPLFRAVPLVLAIAAMASVEAAWADSPAVRSALARGDCQAAGTAVNDGLGREDAEAYFLAGFMYDAGTCVEADPSRAARLYQRASALGNNEASLALAMLTGLGRGVPQDYAAAHRLFRGDKPAACDMDASADGPTALGYAETLARLAWRQVKYPISANANALEASIDVVLSPGNGVLELARVRVDPEIGSHVPRTHDFTDPIEAAYRDAQARAPRPALSSDVPVRVVTPWRFVMPRDVNQKKVRLEGFVTIGEVCLVH